MGYSVYEEGEYVDSADITHHQPLFEVVKSKLDNWRNIGAPGIILEWIANGVNFQPTHTIPTFYHKQMTHEPDARAYWHSRLKPHYIGSGAIRAIPPPPTKRNLRV